jgi:RHS repeat-associated protein
MVEKKGTIAPPESMSMNTSYCCYKSTNRFPLSREKRRRLYCFLLILVSLIVTFAGQPELASAAAVGATPGSFRVSESGAAIYTIPIAVPPGTAGMAPNLSLTYSSQGGNGILGIGWSLSGLSGIYRCPKTIAQNGVKGSINFNNEDRFCLDGQRLIVVTGSYGAHGAEYRTQTESYSRIISYSSAGNGPAWFKVWTKDGQIAEYGNTADSRIEAQGRVEVRQWGVNKVSDTKGNYLAVSYSENNANGEAYVSRIDYTGNVGAGVAPYHSVRFIYEARPDVTSSYLAGSIIKSSMRLVKIQSVGGVEYRLSYKISPSTQRSRLSGITQCSVDGSCFAPSLFSWLDRSNNFVDLGAILGGAYGNWDGAADRIRVMDVNGDGLADIVIGPDSGGNWHVLRSTGKSFVNDGAWITGAYGGWDGAANRIRVMDVNSDGLADIVIGPDSDGNWYVLRSTGRSFVNDGAWITGAYGNWDGAADRIPEIDVNGDGLADIVIGPDSNGNWYVLRSTGKSFVNDGAWITGAYGGWDGAADRIRVMDVNSDGLADIVIGPDSGGNWYVLRSTGRSFVNDGAWITGAYGNWGGAADRIRAMDVNGDGLADIVIGPDSGGNWYVLRSTGRSFVNDGAWITGAYGGWDGQSTRIRALDINGDGIASILLGPDRNGSWYHLDRNGSNLSADLLGNISNGFGSTTTIAYKPLTDTGIYTKDTNAAYPYLDFQGPIYVVAKTLASNGIGGNYATNYRYAGAKLHLTGGGFLGFRKVNVTDAQTGIVTSTTYRQDYPNQGLPASVEKRTTSGQLLNQVQNTWQSTNLGAGVYHRSDLIQTLEQSWDLNGAPMPRTKTTTLYDAYANPTRITVATDDSYTTVPVKPYGNVKLTQNTYSNNATTWMLGRLTRATVTSTLPSGASATRTSAFAYEPSSGLLVQEVIEPDNPSLKLVTNYTLDGFGNRKTSAVSGVDIATRSNATTFDSQGRFPISARNALGHTETRAFDAAFGNPLSLKGPNGLTTTWGYDGFGRKTQENRPDGTRSITTYAWCDATCPTYAKYRVISTVSGEPQSIAYFDSLNREIRRTTVSFDGRISIQETQYDSWGRVAATSRPYFVGDPVRWTRHQYDILGRVIQTTEPDGGVTFTEYDGLTTLVADPLDHTKQHERNGLGQIVKTTDALNATLRFFHDPFGNLSETIDPQGNRVRIGYDLRGRKISMSDPDMGNWTYRYNVLGELLQQTDGKGQVTALVYDALGRMTQRNELGMTSTWQWDIAAMGIGKLARFGTNNGHSRSYGYDGFGRINVVKTTIGTSVFSLTTQYDSFSRVLKTIYPTGFALHNIYTSNGYLAEVRDATTQKPFWQAKSVDAAGRVLEEVLGNGLTTRRAHDVVGRTTGIRTTTAAGAAIQQLAVKYDLAGNVLFRDDLVTRRTHTFTYDEVNRLTSDLSNNGSLLSLRYDAIGNITYKSDVGSYAYGVKPHAVTQITGTLNATLVYDANGNQTQGLGNRTVSYTAWDMPAKITRGTATLTYAYDANHERFRQIGPEGTTIYLNPRVDLGAHFEQTTFPGGSKESRHHIYAGAQVIGELVMTGTGVKTTRYFHSDQLGSIDVVTNDLGNVVARYEYQPFGTRTLIQGDASSTKHGFTGHEHLTNVGLIHMNGRVYDPVTARFLSADPTIQFPGNLQSYNRYSYVMNNPLAFTDPSGYGLFSFLGSLWRNPIVRTVLAITAAAITGPAFSMFSTSIFGGSFAFANTIAAGFVGGVVQTGNLNGGVTGALSAGLFDVAGVIGASNIGQQFGLVGRIASHSAAGCVAAEVSGGKCGQGALAAGFSATAGPVFEHWKGTGQLVARSVVGGTASALGGGKFANGAMTGAFAYLFMPQQSDGSREDGLFESALDVTGKIWALPNTMIGLAYGGIGHVAGWAMETNPKMSFANNAIQFENNPLMKSAMTFGNVIVYADSVYFQPNSQRGQYTLGYEEMQHTYQAQVLGPLYFPAHIASGTTGLLMNRRWHGPSAFLEIGPHSENPRPW